MRNINPFHFAVDNLRVVPANEGGGVAEFVYKNSPKEYSDTFTLKKMSESECRQIVSSAVHEFLKQHVEPDSKIVVGISGGGDSNALLDALVSFNDFPIRLCPIMLKGIPDWDWAVPRALALCDKYGLKLRIMEENEVKGLMNIPDDNLTLSDRFEKFFPGDDFEFWGTSFITLALIKVAHEEGSPYICTGSNLEDMLSEALYRSTNSKPPLPVPVREIDIESVKRIFPLWLVPKKIIDGCFPKYSLKNYSERYPCVSFGRSLYYQMAYSIQSAYPAMAERMMLGFSELAKHFPLKYRRDPDLGFPILEDISFPLKNKYLRMIKTDFRQLQTPLRDLEGSS